MNVSLSPELVKLIEEKVKSGLYHSPSEVVCAALKLLAEHDERQTSRLNELRAEVQKGLADIEQGRLISGDQVIAEIRKRNEASSSS